jgi:hypothetical protein
MRLRRAADDAENQFVAASAYLSVPMSGIWIGASDSAVEGEWRWTDGDLFWLGDRGGSVQNGLYEAWYDVQPSGQQDRHCCMLDSDGAGGWLDVNCDFLKEYACESL